MSSSPFIQSRISAARFLVVGCGALGNEVLKNLVLMGARHLTVVDFDRVEMGNLSRSVLFSRAHAGLWKVDVVAERLREMNPDVTVQTVCGDVAYDLGLGLVRQQDVVLGCVDNRWARYCINRLCMRAGVPWVDGGIDTLEGTVRVFAPGRNCYACNLGPEGLKDLARRMPCSGMIRREEAAGHAPTTVLSASVVGAVQVQEALKLLHPEALSEGKLTSLCGKMYYYEGASLSGRVADFAAYDPECPVHECWAPVQPTSVTPRTPVGEALSRLQEELQCPSVSLELTGDCFVDYVVRRDNDSRREVMLPGRAVAAFVERDPELGGLPFSSLYQHEFRTVDSGFPYPSLSLEALGIPARDVLKVCAPARDYYMEMA